MVVSCRRREKKSEKYQKRGKKRRLKHSENLANLQEFLSFKQLFQLVIPENTSYFFLPRASLDEICSRTHFTTCYKAHVCRLLYIVGNLRSNDVDGKENVKKNNWFNKPKQQLRTCITLFWTFLSCFCTTTKWKCLILRFMEDVNRQRRIFFSLSELRYGPLKFSFRTVRLLLTK